MAADGVGEVVATESQLVWREVKECLGRENFDEAVQLCNKGATTTSTRLRLDSSVEFLLPAVM